VQPAGRREHGRRGVKNPGATGAGADAGGGGEARRAGTFSSGGRRAAASGDLPRGCRCAMMIESVKCSNLQSPKKEQTMNLNSSDDKNFHSERAAEIYHLPNGLSVYHINKHETDFLYKEIFVERAYLKHGIRLNASACVFDVGANIGMFTLFIKQECAAASVHAFEPTPELNRIIKLNVSRYGQSVKVYQNGISDREGEATFTYYPDYTIMSGFHADATGDAGILSSGIRNLLAGSNPKPKFIERRVQEKLGKKTEIKCQLKTISSIIREAKIEQIDLLKIDAEKSELAILKGIQENDWPKIKQMVLEVHAIAELEVVIPLLKQKGFKIEVEQEGLFANSGIYNCFAIRA
jgi:FkbM family methyltransferase